MKKFLLIFLNLTFLISYLEGLVIDSLDEVLEDYDFYFSSTELQQLTTVRDLIYSLPEEYDVRKTNENLVLKEIEERKMYKSRPTTKFEFTWNIELIIRKLMKLRTYDFAESSTRTFNEVVLHEDEEELQLPAITPFSVIEKLQGRTSSKALTIWYFFLCLSNIGSNFWKLNSFQELIDKGMKKYSIDHPGEQTELDIFMNREIEECDRYHKLFKRVPQSGGGFYFDCNNESLQPLKDANKAAIIREDIMLNSIHDVFDEFPREICLGLVDLEFRLIFLPELRLRQTIEKDLIKVIQVYAERSNEKELLSTITRSYDLVMDWFENFEKKYEMKPLGTMIEKIFVSIEHFDHYKQIIYLRLRELEKIVNTIEPNDKRKENIEIEIFENVKDYLLQKKSDSEFWYSVANISLQYEQGQIGSRGTERDLILPDSVKDDTIRIIEKLPYEIKVNMMYLYDCASIREGEDNTQKLENVLKDYEKGNISLEYFLTNLSMYELEYCDSFSELNILFAKIPKLILILQQQHEGTSGEKESETSRIP